MALTWGNTTIRHDKTRVRSAGADGESVSRFALEKVFTLAKAKILSVENSWDHRQGAPVFTVRGKYQARAWTQWTQGFEFGMALLAFDATGDKFLLAKALADIRRFMPAHVSHQGVHDHGFNNISTYGHWRRLMREGKVPHNAAELDMLELALKTSGAVQAMRWTAVPADPAGAPLRRDSGYIYSFNGPHSLFSDTLRSMRSLVLAWQLGHSLQSENDVAVNLLARALQHGLTTARFNVYYGRGRDAYDTEPGRVAHESIFNITDGRYRCPNSQQGYSPFTTWTRGLAWILLGFAEELEFLAKLDNSTWRLMAPLVLPERPVATVRKQITTAFLAAAQATAEWYISHSFADGMVYWDSGAPNLPRPVVYAGATVDPWTAPEPIDSSAAAIAGQGFLRLANYLKKSQPAAARRYLAMAHRIARTLFSEPYLSTAQNHQGLILHSVYHRPNGWDYIPRGHSIPCGESSLWGDYHALELALLLYRRHTGGKYVTFFD